MSIKVVGLHNVASDPTVSLLELQIDGRPSELDLTGVSQEVPGEPRANWQAPFGERYFTDGGAPLTEQWDGPPDDDAAGARWRVAFYMYFVEDLRPLSTPDGPIPLPARSEPRSELVDAVPFESPE